MTEPFADRIIRRIGQAAELFYRFVMLVVPAGACKTVAHQEVREQTVSLLPDTNFEYES